MTETEIIEAVKAGRLSQRKAAAMLGRSRQYVRKAANPEYREREIARDVERYWNMSGFERNRDLMRKRRQKALKRRAARNEERAANPAMAALVDAMFGDLLGHEDQE